MVGTYQPRGAVRGQPAHAPQDTVPVLPLSRELRNQLRRVPSSHRAHSTLAQPALLRPRPSTPPPPPPHKHTHTHTHTHTSLKKKRERHPRSVLFPEPRCSPGGSPALCQAFYKSEGSSWLFHLDDFLSFPFILNLYFPSLPTSLCIPV